jgi:hypothetical protein
VTLILAALGIRWADVTGVTGGERAGTDRHRAGRLRGRRFRGRAALSEFLGRFTAGLMPLQN